MGDFVDVVFNLSGNTLEINFRDESGSLVFRPDRPIRIRNYNALEPEDLLEKLEKLRVFIRDSNLPDREKMLRTIDRTFGYRGGRFSWEQISKTLRENQLPVPTIEFQHVWERFVSANTTEGKQAFLNLVGIEEHLPKLLLELFKRSRSFKQLILHHPNDQVRRIYNMFSLGKTPTYQEARRLLENLQSFRRNRALSEMLLELRGHLPQATSTARRRQQLR